MSQIQKNRAYSDEAINRARKLHLYLTKEHKQKHLKRTLEINIAKGY
jgi:hypothetical protein